MGVLFTLRWAARDLRRRWGQVLAIAFIIGIGTGVYAGLGSTAEWRRQSNDASFAQLHMYDLRVTTAEGVDAPTGSMAAVLSKLPDPGIVATAEERFIADTQVDASTADKSILVPGRLVGMDLSHGGPHVNQVRVADGDGRPLTESDTGRPVVLVEQNFARFYDLPPERTLRLSGNQAVKSVGIGVAPEYFFVTTEEGGFFARSQLRSPLHLVADRPEPGRASRSRQRHGAHAGTRGRPQGRGPSDRDGVRAVGRRPRRDGDAEAGRGRLPGALRRHQRRPAVLEHPRRPDPRRRRLRGVQPGQPDGGVATPRDRHRHGDGVVTPAAGRAARCWSAPRSRWPAQSSVWS